MKLELTSQELGEINMWAESALESLEAVLETLPGGPDLQLQVLSRMELVTGILEKVRAGKETQ